MKSDPKAPEVLRRPISARDTRWAAAVARALASSGLRPNHISLLSAVFGLAAGVSLFWLRNANSPGAKILLLAGAAAAMQLRLLCNLFDGMVAIEGGFKTKSGEVYNELPDRFSDIFIFVGAAYSLPDLRWMPELGWAAALLSVMTAYLRAFGGSAGARQYFCGPMAKQQRMAVMTFACVAAVILLAARSSFEILPWALDVVIVGCVITIARRTLLIIADLESK
jgi:phosphatidylglycerophosphate synthase